MKHLAVTLTLGLLAVGCGPQPGYAPVAYRTPPKGYMQLAAEHERELDESGTPEKKAQFRRCRQMADAAYTSTAGNFRAGPYGPDMAAERVMINCLRAG